MDDDRERKKAEMIQRTKRFALASIRLYASLPRNAVFNYLGRQLMRSGASVGAHYREACRAKSRADFIHKIETALQELDEVTYWLDLLGEINSHKSAQSQSLIGEANQLIAIFVTVVRNVKAMPAAR